MAPKFIEQRPTLVPAPAVLRYRPADGWREPACAGAVPVERFRREASGSFSGVITGVFLAESASVVDNKLSVSGGVLSRFMVGPDREAHFVLVVLTQTEPESPVRLVEVEIVPPTDGESLVIECELPDAAVGGEIGFAFFNMDVSLPVDGRWVFVVSGGGGTFSLPLLVSS